MQRESRSNWFNYLVEESVKRHKAEGQIIENLGQVEREILDTTNVVIPRRHVRTAMSQHLNMSYRRTRTIVPQANTQRCLVLRQ